MNPIADPEVLEQEIAVLDSAGWIGIDTEFLREKTYYPLLCLIQISGADNQDLEVLEQAIGTQIHGIYDTQIAASFCGYGEQVSYAGLVESICGATLEKSLTRTDWSKRPLSRDQLQYALDDVAYLNEIRAFFDEELDKMGRTAWFEQECERVLGLRDYEIDPDDAWKRLKGGSKIPLKSQFSARTLAAWRERKAQKVNRPREWILPSRSIIDISITQPANLQELAKIESLHQGILRNSGKSILRILQKNSGTESMEPVWNTPRNVLDKTDRARVRRVMAWIREFSEQSRISQSLLANRAEVESFIGGDAEIPLFRGWRNEFVGKRVMAEFG
jgi:ribonuclease D